LFTNQASTTRHLLWNRKDPLHLRNSKPNPTDFQTIFCIVFFFMGIHREWKSICNKQINFYIFLYFFYFLVVGHWVLSLSFRIFHWRKRTFKILVCCWNLFRVFTISHIETTFMYRYSMCSRCTKERDRERAIYRSFILFICFEIVLWIISCGCKIRGK